MDAASNNSVEDIRGIKEKVNFLPTLAKYRVYIIDEVHMLSTGAFNALLKTLEEPPAHVKFILATTEPQKLPTTILSRCQRFDFKKISNEDMIKRLNVVCQESGIQVTEPALNLIATLSEGAARDALSILERCLQDGETNIDEDKIKDLVGIPKFVYVHGIIKAIIDKNIEEALKAIEDTLDEGKDLENFLWEMIKHTRDILMYKVSKKTGLYNEEEMKQIAEISEKASKEELINIIYKLSELEGKMRASSQKTIIFQTEVIKLCVTATNQNNAEPVGDNVVIPPTNGVAKKHNHPTATNLNNDATNTAANLNNAETNVGANVVLPPIEGIAKKHNHPTATNLNNAATNVGASIARPPIEEPTKSVNKTSTPLFTEPGNTINEWQNVITKLKTQGKVMLYANLINTEAVEINDMTVAIRFQNGLNAFRKELLQKPENLNLLTKEISILCGKTMQIKFEDASGTKNAAKQAVRQETKVTAPKEEPDDILESLDIPINFVEEE